MTRNTIMEVKTAELNLFLQGGFFDNSASTATIHAHGHTEIHLAVQGSLCFIVENKEYLLTAGDILAVPQNTYHYCKWKEVGARTVPFQVDKELRETARSHVSPLLTLEFEKAIREARESQNYALVIKYIDLLCSGFFRTEKLPAAVSTDAALIIGEFFSNRYPQQIALTDLAEELSLSEKQTERLVKKYTGNTFLQELTKRRIHAASHLIRSTEMTLGQIAERVGFKSYSGFWKAYKRQGLKEENRG